MNSTPSLSRGTRVTVGSSRPSRLLAQTSVSAHSSRTSLRRFYATVPRKNALHASKHSFRTSAPPFTSQEWTTSPSPPPVLCAPAPHPVPSPPQPLPSPPIDTHCHCHSLSPALNVWLQPPVTVTAQACASDARHSPSLLRNEVYASRSAVGGVLLTRLPPFRRQRRGGLLDSFL